MMELVDILGLGSSSLKRVRVQVPFLVITPPFKEKLKFIYVVNKKAICKETCMYGLIFNYLGN